MDIRPPMNAGTLDQTVSLVNILKGDCFNVLNFLRNIHLCIHSY